MKWRSLISPLSLNYELGNVYSDIADIIETEMRRADANASVNTQIDSYCR